MALSLREENMVLYEIQSRIAIPKETINMTDAIMGVLDALMNLLFNAFRKVVGTLAFVAIAASLTTVLFMSVGYAIFK